MIHNDIKLNNFLYLRHIIKHASCRRLITVGVVARLESWKCLQRTIDAVLELKDSHENNNFRLEIIMTGIGFKYIENELRQFLDLAIDNKVL